MARSRMAEERETHTTQQNNAVEKGMWKKVSERVGWAGLDWAELDWVDDWIELGWGGGEGGGPRRRWIVLWFGSDQG